MNAIILNGIMLLKMPNGRNINMCKFIYECFHGIINDNEIIIHIDGNVNNNCIDNLKLLRNEEIIT
jgi:hypothetical protein